MSFPSVGSHGMNNWDQSAAIQPSSCLEAIPANYDSSNIFLFSSNTKSNPGPHHPNKNTIYCIICSAKIKRGFEQETTPSCTEIKCQLRCHQSCNGLTVVQTCHTKYCGNNIFWKCPEHGTGIAEIVVLPWKIFEQPTRTSAAGKLCSVCSAPISPRYADLAYHCAETSCSKVCHLILTCRGFPIPCGEARQCELATQIWKCHQHTSTVNIAQVSQQKQQQQQSLQQPAPPPSLAEAKDIKEKFGKMLFHLTIKDCFCKVQQLQ